MSIKHKLLQYGVVNTLKRINKSFLRKVSIRHEAFLFCTLDLNSTTFVLVEPMITGEIIELSLDLIDNITEIDLTASKKRLFKKRLLNDSYKGYGFLYMGTLVYYTWISLVDFEMSIPEENIRLSENEALLLDSFCLPKFRKLGIHQYMNNFRLNQMKEHGKDTAVAIVLKENKPARRTQFNSGFRCEKYITYNKMFNLFEKTSIKEKKIKLINTERRQ